MNCNEWSRPRPLLPDNLLHTDNRLYVEELQRFIRTIPDENDNLRLIAIDGIYGPETHQAVADFQRQYGLTETGRADNLTWNMLFDEYERLLPFCPVNSSAHSRTLSLGDSGSDVLVLQSLINQLSDQYVNITPVPYTGDYDDATEAAVEELQRILRLPANGKTDCFVFSALYALLDLI